MQPKINRWLDLLDRVGWTAIQAAAGAVLAFTTTNDAFSWQTFFTFVGYTTAVAVVKVVIGQRTGSDDTGALIGTSVIEPPPEADTKAA